MAAVTTGVICTTRVPRPPLQRGVQTVVTTVGVVLATAAAPASASSALSAARALTAPMPLRQKNGEFEGHEFWDEHDSLLTDAWRELGPKHPDLYTFGPAFQWRYIHHDLRKAATLARAGKGEGAVRGLFEEVIPGVFASNQLFTKAFQEELLDELEHVEGSGIPRRRPNGMNRYGVILDQVGMQSALAGFATEYVRPLAATLFPDLVGPLDAEEHYAFTVRYEATGDTELAKHANASVVTLNLCLGRLGWQGGGLRFFRYEGLYALPSASAGAGEVAFEPGLAIFHRGQHKHQALQLLSGERTNIIIWLFAKHGVVRVMPYGSEEQQTAAQRWAPARAQQSGLPHEFEF